MNNTGIFFTNSSINLKEVFMNNSKDDCHEVSMKSIFKDVFFDDLCKFRTDFGVINKLVTIYNNSVIAVKTRSVYCTLPTTNEPGLSSAIYMAKKCAKIFNETSHGMVLLYDAEIRKHYTGGFFMKTLQTVLSKVKIHIEPHFKLCAIVRYAVCEKD